MGRTGRASNPCTTARRGPRAPPAQPVPRPAAEATDVVVFPAPAGALVVVVLGTVVVVVVGVLVWDLFPTLGTVVVVVVVVGVDPGDAC